MEVVLDEAMLARLQAAQVDINIHISAGLNISPFVARQKINVLLLDKVGTGLLAGPPQLVAGAGRLSWRVPVILAIPGRPGAEVGAIDVDVQTGQVLADVPLLSEITFHANQLAASSAS